MRGRKLCGLERRRVGFGPDEGSGLRASPRKLDEELELRRGQVAFVQGVAWVIEHLRLLKVLLFVGLVDLELGVLEFEVGRFCIRFCSFRLVLIDGLRCSVVLMLFQW